MDYLVTLIECLKVWRQRISLQFKTQETTKLTLTKIHPCYAKVKQKCFECLFWDYDQK